MSDREKSSSKSVSEIREISFDYLKSNFFRVVSADGVFGGITTDGKIHMDFWNERSPIPDQIVHKINSDGTLGPEISRNIRDGLVREVEVGVVVSLEFARQLLDWLQEKIDDAERHKQYTQSLMDREIERE